MGAERHSTEGAPRQHAQQQPGALPALPRACRPEAMSERIGDEVRVVPRRMPHAEPAVQREHALAEVVGLARVGLDEVAQGPLQREQQGQREREPAGRRQQPRARAVEPARQPGDHPRASDASTS
jgi:hypothetical protein